MSQQRSYSTEDLEFLYHHVFLPPNIPQRDDHSSVSDNILLDITHVSLQDFRRFLTPTDAKYVERIISMTSDMRRIFDAHSYLDELRLSSILRKLALQGGILPLYVKVQNSALIIRKLGANFLFESFEVSPRNEAVYSTWGRLKRSFPTCAVEVPGAVFEDGEFQRSLAFTIAKMSQQHAPDMQPKVMKGGTEIDEFRDTAIPAMITEYLMSILKALGSSSEPISITKNTREDVLWNNCKFPWRRSPLWLFIRVTIQRELRQLSGSDDLYKLFTTYLHAKILDLSINSSPDEELYLMSSKVSRRLLKLQCDIPLSLRNTMSTCLRSARQVVESNWKQSVSSKVERPGMDALTPSNVTKDTQVPFAELDRFLHSLSQGPVDNTLHSFTLSVTLPTYVHDQLPVDFEDHPVDCQKFNLIALEAWIEHNLRTWLKSRHNRPATCVELLKFMIGYHQLAGRLYHGCPERLAMMILSLADLWVALDEVACTIYPLLKDYDPLVPVHLLQSLVLPFKAQMQRLRAIETYCKNRESRAKADRPSPLQSFGHAAHFCVRYVDSSREHQDLLQRILETAQEDKDMKCAELVEKKARYYQLMSLYNSAAHDMTLVVSDRYHGYTHEECKGNCPKCGYLRDAQSIDIAIYEWPLPSKLNDAKATVFELRVPSGFGAWRDATVYFLLEVLGCEYSSKEAPRASHHPGNYEGLRRFFQASSETTQRSGILSQIKPHGRTHRREKSIENTQEEDVCLENALRYQYYDFADDCFVATIKDTSKVDKLCSYRLPDASASLSDYLRRPSSSPNGVPHNEALARQSQCPAHMSIQEFKAYTTLPFGYRIQWQNILAQLAMPALNYTRPETSSLFFHVMYHCGPVEDHPHCSRDGHVILERLEFGRKLMQALREALSRIRQNWASALALETFVCIATRLLTLCSAELEAECLAYLEDARDVALEWMDKLQTPSENIGNAQRPETLRQIAKIALVAGATFDVDVQHLAGIFSSCSEISKFIRCLIISQENTISFPTEEDGQQVWAILVERWNVLRYKALPILVQKATDDARGLDNAIMRVWPDHLVGSQWTQVASSYREWLQCTTTKRGGLSLRTVHISLLTGELLVDGLPLSRLPASYERHPMYHRLFKDTGPIEVAPSDDIGMSFTSRQQFSKQRISFDLREGTSDKSMVDLLLKGVEDRKVLVPARFFSPQLPEGFITNYTHWYDAQKVTIELRPDDDPFSTNTQNLQLVREGKCWKLSKSGANLIFANTSSLGAITRALMNLDSPPFCHAWFLSASEELEICLPRLKLDFSIAVGSPQILSKQFRGMSVDLNQDIGTLIGIGKKLVLKDSVSTERTVIIPEGTVSYSRPVEEGFRHVSVRISSDGILRNHVYRVDSLLGRLVDNGSLQSKLFLAYLHALSAHCLPDPLTKLTGTESTLSILRSAAVRSVPVLTSENISMLERIANLAPKRGFYPEDLRVMQTIDWDQNLSFFSQSDQFYIAVQQILEHAQRQSKFYPDSPSEWPDMRFTNADLVHRGLNRGSSYQTHGFGAKEHTIEHDVQYLSRDRGQGSQRAQRATLAAALLHHTDQILTYPGSTDLSVHLWDLLKSCGKIGLEKKPLDSSVLVFHCKWSHEDSFQENIAPIWCSLYVFLTSKAGSCDIFRNTMWLSAIAFGKNGDMDVIAYLLACLKLFELSKISPPSASCFDLQLGTCVQNHEIMTLLRDCQYPFHASSEARLAAYAHESYFDLNKRRNQTFQENARKTLSDLTSRLTSQWPCEVPNQWAEFTASHYFDARECMENLRPYFKKRYDNLQLQLFIKKACSIIRSRFQPRGPEIKVLVSLPVVTETWRRKTFVESKDVFQMNEDIVLPQAPPNINQHVEFEVTSGIPSSRVETLCKELRACAEMQHEFKYVEELQESLTSLKSRREKIPVSLEGVNLKPLLVRYHSDCLRFVEHIYNTMLDCTREGASFAARMAEHIGCYPRISPMFFLRQLSWRHWETLPGAWRTCIVKYGLAITELQRASRLLSSCSNVNKLKEEIKEIGHENWSPSQYPETLLMEVESGLLVRARQEEVAKCMREPPLHRNAVMQCLMGEGKSSVLLNILAAHLADGTRLVRIIVAKPQSKQALQMLVSKLGGLLDHRIYHLPCSRALKLTQDEADDIYRICQECRTHRGVLLVQPEHLLSFQLMGLECLIDGRGSIGRSLLKTQHFFDTTSRDIVDESDENFDVRFELVYTLGLQRPTSFSPGRWTLIQKILDLVARYARKVKTELPSEVEVNDRIEGRFPSIRIFRPDATNRLLAYLTDHICAHGLPSFAIQRQEPRCRELVKQYISQADLSTIAIESVERETADSFWSDSTKDSIMLLRGLIAGDILRFVFETKRWRVNYGTDFSRYPRTELAVPYRGKDSPSSRSEFSQPDVVILLTSLSYYYNGLDDTALYTALRHVQKSDQAQAKYSEWAKLEHAPALECEFRRLENINLEDCPTCEQEIFPNLRYSKGAIDYYLAYIVFPAEMKEFPHKLSSSGWDLGKSKRFPTTGFSGTNDTHPLLPLDMAHHDLEHQRPTNALVLDYILGDENIVKLLPTPSDVKGSLTHHLIKLVVKMDPPVRVLIDVGAQILDLDNRQVATKWLNITKGDTSIRGAVFFNAEDDISVIDRTGLEQPLQMSPFAERLSECVVYMDQIHARGSDFKLPVSARAAVTLGPRLTKDRLTQACMRMRQLGKGQSIVFIIPQEVQISIRRRSSSTTIGVKDVLTWAISETCKSLRNNIPLWAVQGNRHEKQMRIWNGTYSSECYTMSPDQAKGFQEQEARSIDDMYRPKAAERAFVPVDFDSTSTKVQEILERCRQFRNSDFTRSQLQEEQERELSPEIEFEREIERPRPATPESHEIHPHIRDLVTQGRLQLGECFVPAFRSLQRSTVYKMLDLSQFVGEVLVTKDFDKVVKLPSLDDAKDAFERPVQWILVPAKKSEKVRLIIISPFEAHTLLPSIEKYQNVTLAIYLPRSDQMFRALDDLTLFTQGAPLNSASLKRQLNTVTELNLFAGQLYMNNFEEYVEVCRFLGLAWKATEKGQTVRPDGFIVGAGRFGSSPVSFMGRLISTIRRNGESINRTHVGRLLDSELLESKDFL